MLRLMLLGETGHGKSRLGNKLSGKNEFKESAECKSCTKNIKKVVNDFGIEITDTQGFLDTEEDDKKGLISIFNDIKANKPNVIAYVQNSSNVRFGKSSKYVLEEICKMFSSKSIWNHIIIIFTFAGTISKENREKRAKSFLNSVLEVLTKYYEKNNVNDNLPIPKKINHYFVELGDTENYKLDDETKNNLTDIMGLIHFLPPIGDVNERLIIEKKIKKGCQESLEKYERYIEDEYGRAKQLLAGISFIRGVPLLGKGAGFAASSGLIAAGVTATAPIIIVGLGAFGLVSYLGAKLGYKVMDNQEYWDTKLDKEHLNEDYITYDEVTIIYNEGPPDVKRINVQNFTRVISK